MLKQFQTDRHWFMFALLALYAAMVFMFDANETNLMLIYSAYGLLCLSFMLRIHTIRLYPELGFLMAYFVYGFLSLTWSDDIETSFARTRGVGLLLVFLILAVTFFVDSKKPVYLLVSLVVGSVALTGYMFITYGVSGVLNAISTAERIGLLVNNSNTLANALVVGIIALIGFTIYYKKWFLFLLLIPMGACFLATNSRTATISLLVGVFIMVFLLLKSSKRSTQLLFRIAAIAAGLTVAWLIVRNIPATQKLILRFENAILILTGGNSVLRETSVQSRVDYIELGWEQFLASPVFGNGIGCAGYALQEKYGLENIVYLHNNYIEILASGGIVGFVLYYMPYALLLHKFTKRIFKERDLTPVTCISFALLIAKLVGHLGTVMYYSKVEYFLLALWIAVIYIPVKNNEP